LEKKYGKKTLFGKVKGAKEKVEKVQVPLGGSICVGGGVVIVVVSVIL